MRQLILTRLDEIKSRENGFDKHTMRWSRLKFISINWRDVVYKNLTDEELLQFYELTIRRCSLQI